MTKRPGSGCSANKGLKDRRRDSSCAKPRASTLSRGHKGVSGGSLWGCPRERVPPRVSPMPLPAPSALPRPHHPHRCAVPPPVPTSSLPADPCPPAWSQQQAGTLCAVTPVAPLCCHPNPATQHAPSLATNPLHNPQPGEEIPPAPSLPFCQTQESILLFWVYFFFSMLSATLDEQSPPLRLPSLTHVVIRSCRYPAVICLVSALAQTRLANRCGLQLRAAASHFPTLADGGAAGRHTLVPSLPQCPAGCPARCLQGFPACKGGEVAGAN